MDKDSIDSGYSDFMVALSENRDQRLVVARNSSTKTQLARCRINTHHICYRFGRLIFAIVNNSKACNISTVMASKTREVEKEGVMAAFEDCFSSTKFDDATR